jgi:hypothetical protein
MLRPAVRPHWCIFAFYVQFFVRISNIIDTHNTSLTCTGIAASVTAFATAAASSTARSTVCASVASCPNFDCGACVPSGIILVFASSKMVAVFCVSDAPCGGICADSATWGVLVRLSRAPPRGGAHAARVRGRGARSGLPTAARPLPTGSLLSTHTAWLQLVPSFAFPSLHFSSACSSLVHTSPTNDHTYTSLRDVPECVRTEATSLQAPPEGVCEEQESRQVDFFTSQSESIVR